MADRTVLVRLRANADQYITEMKQAEAATSGVGDAAKKSGKDIDKANADAAKSATKAGKAIRGVGDDVDYTAVRFGKFRNDLRGMVGAIDTTNDRMAWLAQGILALAPAAVPLAASVVPSLSALAAGATVAVGSVTALMLAFNGVGDAMGALNDYQLEPTAKNLAAVQQAMADLSPAGQEFVMFLDDIGEQFAILKDDAQAGMFPGMMDGIDAVMDRLPQFRTIISELSEGIGILSSEAGQGLGGQKFDAFFTYLENEAQPIMLDFGRALGNFAEGLANMMVEMGGLTGDFTGGLLEMSRDFAEWSRNLESNQSFQDFLAYVSESSPKVLDLLGSLSDMFVELVRAAAPVGDVMLPILTGLADAIGFLASTPLGHFAVLAAALTSIYGRMAALSKITSGGVFGTLTARSRDAAKSTKGLSVSMLDAQRASRGFYLSQNAVNEGMRSGSRSSRLYFAEINKGRQAVKDYGRDIARSYGPAAGQAALLGLALSPIPEKMGMSSTAMGAMVGSMAGPWGTAIGAAGGAVLDFAGANDEMIDSLKAAKDAVASGAGWEEITAKVEQAQTAYDDFNSHVAKGAGEQGKLFSGAALGVVGLAANFKDLKATTSNLFSGIGGESDLEKTEKELKNLETGMEGIDSIGKDLGISSSKTTEYLNKLGITAEDVAAASEKGGEGLDSMGQRITNYVANADSVEGRTNAVADSIANLGQDAIATADSATALATALDALLTPEQNLVQTQDAWTQSLRQLNEDLAANKTLVGKSDAAIQNREAINQRITDLKSLMTAQADAGAGPKKLANTLSQGTQSIIEFGEKAGMSRKELRGFLNQMGLTPKMVKTVFEAAGIDEAQQKARNLADNFKKIPKSVVSKLRADPGNSDKIITNALKKLDLTKKERRALITIRDKASPTAKQIRRALAILDGKKVTPKVGADTSVAERKMNRVERRAKVLANLKPVIKPDSVIDRAWNGLVKVGKKADDTGNKKPKVTASFVDRATSGLTKLDKKADDVGNKKPKITVSADTSKANSNLGDTQNKASALDRMSPNVVISATDNASSKISSVSSALTNLNGDEAVTYITTVRRTRKGNADGGTIEPDPVGLAWGGTSGTVPGSRVPYGDKVDAKLAPGEEVITNRNGEADRNRAELKAANAGAKLAVIGWAWGGTVGDEDDEEEDDDWVEHLANGGTAGRRRKRGRGGKKKGKSKNLTKAIKNLKGAIDDTTDALGNNQRALAKSEKLLDSETRARENLVSSVKSALDRDIWTSPSGGEGQTWNSAWAGGEQPATVATVSKQLQIQRAEAQQYNAIMRKLIGRGLSGGALAEVAAGGLERAKMFSGQSRSQIAQFERLYNSTQASVSAAASRVGDTAATTRELTKLRNQVAGLNKTIRTLDKRREDQRNRLEKLREKNRGKNAKKTGKAAGDAVKNSAKKGRRNRR